MTYFGWEMELLRMIQELHTQLLTPVLISLSWINNHGEFWILTGLILTVIPKTRKCGISVLLAMLFGTLITDLTLKGICARPRPYYYTEYMDGNHIRLLIEMKEKGAAAFISFPVIVCAALQRRYPSFFITEKRGSQH